MKAAVADLDDLGRRSSPVHRLDARAKVLATGAFLVTVMSFPRQEVSALTPFLFFPLVLASLGGVPFGFLFRRVLAALPFALLVALGNPFFDRVPVGVGPWETTAGWMSFSSILFRFLLTVLAALVLAATTGVDRLTDALGRLGLPRVFVVQMSFFYRTLFVVGEEASRMKRSLLIRSHGNKAPSFRSVVSLLGHLLLRAMARAERIHGALRARGYDGRLPSLGRRRAGWTDLGFLAVCGASFAAARVWNLAEMAGRWAAP